MFYPRAKLPVAPVSFFLSGTQWVTPFPLIQDAIVPSLVPGDLFETVADVVSIAKQAALICADQVFECRAVVWGCPGVR